MTRWLEAAKKRQTDSRSPDRTDKTQPQVEIGEKNSRKEVLSVLSGNLEKKSLIFDLYEERAAIREFDGGQDRIDAERAAMNDTAQALGIPLSIARSIIKGDTHVEC